MIFARTTQKNFSEWTYLTHFGEAYNHYSTFACSGYLRLYLIHLGAPYRLYFIRY